MIQHSFPTRRSSDLIRTIIDNHEGTIEARSVEGAGTTFTVRLPTA